MCLMLSLLALPFSELTAGDDLAMLMYILQMFYWKKYLPVFLSLSLSYNKDLISITRV